MVIYKDESVNDKTMILKNKNFLEGTLGLSLYFPKKNASLMIKLLIDKALKSSLNVLISEDSLSII